MTYALEGLVTTTWTETQQRILREASDLTIGKVLVTIVAFPFFVLGWLLGAIWVVGALVWQAAWVGIAQARATLVKRN